MYCLSVVLLLISLGIATFELTNHRNWNINNNPHTAGIFKVFPFIAFLLYLILFLQDELVPIVYPQACGYFGLGKALVKKMQAVDDGEEDEERAEKLPGQEKRS